MFMEILFAGAITLFGLDIAQWLGQKFRQQGEAFLARKMAAQ
jgi:hypothetical protein